MCPKCGKGSYLDSEASQATMGTKDYTPGWLPKLFHSFPHLDLYMKKVDADFKPDDPRYGESLVFWGAIPILFLVLTLLLFLVYFCYRCCQRDVEKQRPVPCLRWSMAIIAIITVGAAGVAFYGNEEAKKGITGYSSEMHGVDDTVASIKAQVQHVNNTVHDVIDVELKRLEAILVKHLRQEQDKNKKFIKKLRDKAMGKTNTLLEQVSSINREASKVHLSPVTQKIESYSFYRWVATLAVLCWKVLLCLILLIGVARTSKYTLLFFSACGIFTLVLCWALAGLHLSACVGLGDYCVDPKAFVLRVGSKSLKKDTMTYYVSSCDKNTKDPKEVKRARMLIHNMNDTIEDTITKARERSVPVNKLDGVMKNLRPAMMKVSDSISTLTRLVHCVHINKGYSESSRKLCNQALPGVAFVLLGACVAGILLSILVFLASKAWRHFGTSNQPAQKDDLWQKGYYEVDQDDPFLPRGDNASPSYYSRGHHTFPREHIAMERRSTPPPAYNGFEPYSSNTLPLSHSQEDHLERPKPANRQFSRESSA